MKLNIQLFADGTIVIETQVLQKGLEKGIKSIEDKLDTLRKKAQEPFEMNGVTVTGGWNLSEKEQQYYNRLDATLQKLYVKKAEMEIADSKDLQVQKQITNEMQKQELINYGYTGKGKVVPKGPDTPKKPELIPDDTEEQTRKISFNLDGIIKKVGKWALAVFGIRSAYNFVRMSISTLSQYNKNLAKDIENIRYGLASALAPVIQKIVQWAYKFMQAINYIWKVMTGKNLFSNVKKDLDASSKSAQKIQKTIAAFDEMTTLNDTSSGGGGVGDIGNFTEDLTATNLLSEKEKQVLEDIAGVLKTLWDEVLKPMWDTFFKPVGKWLLEHPKALLGILTTLLGLKLISKITKLGTALGGLNPLLAAEIGVIALAAVKIKDELIPAIKETNTAIENAENGLKGNTEQTKKVNEKVIEYAKNLEKLDDVQERNNNIILRQVKSDKELIKQHKEQISITGALTGENKMHKTAMKELDTQMWDNIRTLGQLGEMHKLTNEQAQEFIDTCESQIEELEKQNQKLNENSETYKKNKKSIEELKTQIDKTKGTYHADVKTKTEKQKVDELQKSVNKVEGTHNIKFDSDMNEANKKVNKWLSGIGSAVFAVMFPSLSFAKTLAKFKYHRYGGIINQPGRGVPINIGGESGPEGVIPLNEEQQMDLLGQSIARHMVINLTNINQMNGRIISRELQKIQNQNGFASNWR